MLTKKTWTWIRDTTWGANQWSTQTSLRIATVATRLPRL